MISLVHFNQTRGLVKNNLLPGPGGFHNLQFSTAIPGGYTTCSFEVESVSPYAASRITMYDAIEAWGIGQKVWQGRVKTPIKKQASGRYLVECEGIGIALGKIPNTVTFTSKLASEIFTTIIGYAQVNLLNSSTAYIATTSATISLRDYRETSNEQIFNEIATFEGWDWFVYEGNNSGSLTDGGNRLHYQNTDTYYSEPWVIDFGDLSECEIVADGDEYANAVIVRYGSAAGNYRYFADNAGLQDTLSQAKYTPGKSLTKPITVNTGSSTATTGDADTVGIAWINSRKVNNIGEPWAKGSISLTGKNLSGPYGLMPPYMIRAGHSIRIQGLLENSPNLSDSIDNDSVFKIVSTDYDHTAGMTTLALNDFTDDIGALLAGIENRE